MFSIKSALINGFVFCGIIHLSLMAHSDSSESYENDPSVSQISVSDSEGQRLTAWKKDDTTWYVKGMGLEGSIVLDSQASSATFENKDTKAPLHDLTITVNGTVITTIVGEKGMKRVATSSPKGYTEQVDVESSADHILTAKRTSEDVWQITGQNSSGMDVKGILTIDPATKFVGYKGNNGSFMYKKTLSVERVVSEIATMKQRVSTDELEKSLSDGVVFPDVSSDVRLQVKRLIQSVVDKSED